MARKEATAFSQNSPRGGGAGVGSYFPQVGRVMSTPQKTAQLGATRPGSTFCVSPFQPLTTRIHLYSNILRLLYIHNMKKNKRISSVTQAMAKQASKRVRPHQFPMVYPPKGSSKECAKQGFGLPRVPKVQGYGEEFIRHPYFSKRTSYIFDIS